MTFAEILAVYTGSNGDATKDLYVRLYQYGAAGMIAVNLLRACKASERAKVYRGGGYRAQAYDKKQWSMDNLCGSLGYDAAALGITWGWGIDPKQDYHRHVLYVDLPTGQVSFHTAARGKGPDYPGAWDGVKDQGPTRICKWVASIFETEAKAA